MEREINGLKNGYKQEQNQKQKPEAVKKLTARKFA
jgi:hypothetical protein